MSLTRGRVRGKKDYRISRFAHAYLLLIVIPTCTGFLPNFWSRVLTLSWDSHTHQYITEQAIINVTLETLRNVNKHQHSHANEKMELGRGYWRAVGEVVKSNAAMDFLSSTRSDPVYHFDSERVDSAIAMLRQFWAQTLLSLRAKEYQRARHSLGQLLHSLQDFYSHSNWVEMGQRSIYLHLLQPDEPAFPVAKDDIPTCMECFSATCRGNLLPSVTGVKQHSPLLTSGYFSTYPSKPHGKCSHGGILDSSRHKGAKGGINKDSTSPLFSPHHYLHFDAAKLASKATLAVLKDLRDTVSQTSFLRLFSVKQPPALVIVMDTTGSMFEEITAARRRALSIIQSRTGQSGTFVLVPFHDPDVGPVYETDDPEQFMQHMENLTALGGGDEPEMCLSAIQLALTHSPPLSEIFVFTDASPKDSHLFDTVKALTLERQSKVTFLITEDPSHETDSGGRRGGRGRRETLSPGRFSLYSNLSSVSGGLAVFTSNADIHRVSAIVDDITAPDKVTLLHVESDADSTSSHSFRVDVAVKTVTLHLSGNLTHYNLISPAGHSQSNLNKMGPLAELERFEGLHRISLLSPIEPGQWILQARADGHLTFNVIGDSTVDFLYYFATVANDTHPGLSRMEGNPIAGIPIFLVVAITGLAPEEEVSFSHVTLLAANGESLQQVHLNSSSSSSSVQEELVGRMDSVPRVPFCVRLTGRDGRGNTLERASTEMVQPTHVHIQVLSFPRLVPGHSTVVRFDVQNHGPARLFDLSAGDDCGYLHQRGPHSFPVADRGSIRDQVNLHTPATAEAGETVTLTLTVRAQGSQDSNYAVAYLTVVPPDPDMSPPSCSTTRVESSCPTQPQQCSISSWSVSLAVADRGRSGLAFLQLHQGEGVLALFQSPTLPQDNVEEKAEPSSSGQDHTQVERTAQENHTARLEKGDDPLNVSEWMKGSPQPLWVRYTASCCSPRAQILVWDAAGNMKRCHLSSPQQRVLLTDKITEMNNSAGKTILDSCVLLLLAGLLWTSLHCAFGL